MEVPRGFTRCDECEGDGALIGARWAGGSIRADDPCPSCSGSGLVPTEKLREEAARAVLVPLIQSGEFGEESNWEALWPEDRETVLSYADAVLRKVAEHIREGR